MPDFLYEDQIDGLVCGLDEVGRGPLAGPVVAAAVVIPDDQKHLGFIKDIQDSKKHSAAKRESLCASIHEHFHVGVAEMTPEQIAELNILQASLNAMKNAMQNISDIRISHALVDGPHCPRDMPCSAQALVKGDSKSISIAAASIVAKVYRDKIMNALAAEFPMYGWASNAGYPTKEHMDAIDAYGITDHHRKSFNPVRNFLEFGMTRPPLRTAV